MMSIQETLRLFGITRCYKGFLHTAYAIQLAVENENRLEAVTKEIYMETAFHFNCTWTAVERNIRTAVPLRNGRSSPRPSGTTRTSTLTP